MLPGEPTLAHVLRRLLQYDSANLSDSDRLRRAILRPERRGLLLAQFGRSYGDVKLMQAATGALISGSVIATLMNEHFDPNDIDFYCGQGHGYHVTRYLKAVGDFGIQFSSDHNYENVLGLRQVTTLSNPAGRQINIIETYSDVPLDAILSFHSAPPRGAISWNMFSHYEVERARKGLALVTPETLHLVLDDLSSQVETWEIVHKYMGRGFRFIFHYDKPHECGQHIECPATRRTTMDAGCLHVPLLRQAIPTFVVPAQPLIAWTLGTSTCPVVGRVQGRPVHNASAFQGPCSRIDSRYGLMIWAVRSRISQIGEKPC